MFDQFGMPVRNGGRARTVETRDSVQSAIFLIFATLAISVTFLQKFGFGPNPDAVVPLVVPIVMLAMAYGIVRAKLSFRLMRVGLYLLFIAVSAVTTIIFVSDFSPLSLALYAVLYLPLMVTLPATEATYRRCMRFYSDLALVIVALTLLQHAIQLSVGWTYWPNLDKLLPAQFLVPNYNYVQAIAWGMAYMKPNAVFFLEVSYLSQYLAIALIVEILMFQRTWRMIAFGGTMLATFAGTGPLLVLLCAPLLLLGNRRLKSAIYITVVMMVVGVVAAELGWLDLIAHRFTEFDRGGTSANMRFIEPLNRIVRALDTPEGVYSGIGPGLIEKAGQFQWWPITKAIVEYGLIAGGLFYVFFTYALFDAPRNIRLAICVFIWFGIEGSLLTAINPISCMLFTTMFIADRQQRGSGRGARQSTVNA